MRPDPIPLVLQLAAELGGLALRDLWREVLHLAGGREFTSAEIVAHAALPANHRLRAAMVANCGTVSARSIGQLFSRWQGVDLGGVKIDAIGAGEGGILWVLAELSREDLSPAPTALAERGSIVALPLAGK